MAAASAGFVFAGGGILYFTIGLQRGWYAGCGAVAAAFGSAAVAGPWAGGFVWHALGISAGLPRFAGAGGNDGIAAGGARSAGLCGWGGGQIRPDQGLSAWY